VDEEKDLKRGGAIEWLARKKNLYETTSSRKSLKGKGSVDERLHRAGEKNHSSAPFSRGGDKEKAVPKKWRSSIVIWGGRASRTYQLTKDAIIKRGGGEA